MLLSIGVVATRVGVHPQTLREYERQGLVAPQRTAGGTRRYGDAELARLERIQRLTAEGLSLSGVRYVLELEDRLRRAERCVEELQAELAAAGLRQTEAAGAGTATDDERASRPAAATLVTRSVSVELVHVPRTRRSPRWRNEH